MHGLVSFPPSFSPSARHFVTQALLRDTKRRPSLSQLAAHPWVVSNGAEVPRHVLDLFEADVRSMSYREAPSKLPDNRISQSATRDAMTERSAVPLAAPAAAHRVAAPACQKPSAYARSLIAAHMHDSCASLASEVADCSGNASTSSSCSSNATYADITRCGANTTASYCKSKLGALASENKAPQLEAAAPMAAWPLGLAPACPPQPAVQLPKQPPQQASNVYAAASDAEAIGRSQSFTLHTFLAKPSDLPPAKPLSDSFTPQSSCRQASGPHPNLPQPFGLHKLPNGSNPAAAHAIAQQAANGISAAPGHNTMLDNHTPLFRQQEPQASMHINKGKVWDCADADMACRQNKVDSVPLSAPYVQLWTASSSEAGPANVAPNAAAVNVASTAGDVLANPDAHLCDDTASGLVRNNSLGERVLRAASQCLATNGFLWGGHSDDNDRRDSASERFPGV